MMNRRTLLAGSAAGLAAGGFMQTASAQDIDTAKLYVGFTAGGLSDTMARRLADKLRGHYANSLLVENKPGASGQIAISTVKDSPSDGSVLLFTHSSALSMYPFTFKSLPYKPMQDLLPVSLVCHTNHALCVGPAVPASVTNVKQFLAWAKANPDHATCGTPGLGSMPHLIVTVVNNVAKSDIRVIPFKGTAAAIVDLLGGQISAASGPAGNFLPLVQQGRARLIATSGDTRSSYAPAVATYREQGFPMTAREWYGLYLPAAAKPETQRRAAAFVQTALADPALASGLQSFGVDVASSSPATLASMLEADTKEWKRLIAQIGFTAES